MKKTCLSLAFLLAAGAASAHDTWVAPLAARVSPGATIELDLTSGMAFPALDYAPEPDRLSLAKLRLGGRSLDLKDRVRGAHALRLRAPATAAGIATVGLSTKPRTLTLKPEEVEHYLEEIGAQESAGKLWRERKAKLWRETYRKHAKTFVRVGAAAVDDSWAEPMGLALEIVPEADPTTLRTGETLSLRVLKDGKPLSGFALAALAKGAERRLVTTDAEGRASVALDRSGAWLIAGTELRAVGEAWESDFATLTLDALP